MENSNDEDEKLEELPTPITPAEETIQFIKEALPEQITLGFWIELQELIDKELGKISQLRPVPLNFVQMMKFMNERIPFGKYEGKKVKQIHTKDKAHLIKLCHRPSMFQAKLKRFLLAIESVSKKPLE